MGPISKILSRPRTVMLAGNPFVVGELTLDDIADLQAFLDAGYPDPIPGLRESTEGMEAGARRSALLAAYEAAKVGPPCWSDAEGTRRLLADDGFAELVRVALRHHQPSLTAEEIKAIAKHTTFPEYDGLMRALIRSDPREEIARMLGMRNEPGRTVITWPEAIVEVATMLGRMPHELGSLTLSEFRAVRTGGKPKEVGIPLVPGPGLRKRLAEAKLRVFGSDDGTEEKGAG